MTKLGRLALRGLSLTGAVRSRRVFAPAEAAGGKEPVIGLAQWAAGAGRRLARPPNLGLTASLAERADRQCLWSAKRPEAVRYSPVRLEDQDEGRAVQRK